MKQAIYIIFLSVSFAVIGQTDPCSFPERWIPDVSSFRVINAELDIPDTAKYLPDSVVFSKKQIKIWKEGEVLKGKFRQSGNSIWWKFQTENYKVSMKTFGAGSSNGSRCDEGSLVCELVKCGISFSWIKEDDFFRNVNDVHYKLMPSPQMGK